MPIHRNIGSMPVLVCPIPGLDQIGLKQAGFFVGIKYNQTAPIIPTINEFDDITTTEAKINFKIGDNVKLQLSGMWGKLIPVPMVSTGGNQAIMNYGYNSVAAALGEYKYYLSANDLLDAWTNQYGFKMTHSLNPSTFYELKVQLITAPKPKPGTALTGTRPLRPLSPVWTWMNNRWAGYPAMTRLPTSPDVFFSMVRVP